VDYKIDATLDICNEDIYEPTDWKFDGLTSLFTNSGNGTLIDDRFEANMTLCGLDVDA
jgi:hypothetical protein